MDPSFYFAYELDDDNRLKHVYWAILMVMFLCLIQKKEKKKKEKKIKKTSTNDICTIHQGESSLPISDFRQPFMSSVRVKMSVGCLKLLDAMSEQQTSATITGHDPTKRQKSKNDYSGRAFFISPPKANLLTHSKVYISSF